MAGNGQGSARRRRRHSSPALEWSSSSPGMYAAMARMASMAALSVGSTAGRGKAPRAGRRRGQEGGRQSELV